MKITRINFNFNNEEKALSEIYKNKNFYYNKCIEAIDWGIKNDILNIKIFELKMLNGEIYDAHCHRNQWDEILNTALKFFIENEKYEKCSHIKKLMNC